MSNESRAAPRSSPAERRNAARDPLQMERDSRRNSANAAFWAMVKRVTVLAACVDLAFLVFFLVVGSPLLGWLNVASIAMYGAAYWLVSRRRNLPALILIWLEVIGHATVGTMLVGWDAGFNYYMLMFIPAIVVSGNWRAVALPLVVLFLAYMGLHEAAHHFGALAPLGDTPLQVLNVFNVLIFFCMASYTARFYYLKVLKSERKLRELATRDTLTGLSNRRHLLDLAQQEMARASRGEQQLALVLADIDDFKQINDSHGHDAGDRVLIHVSRLFREICRAQDTVARWGGEEFLFLLPMTDATAACGLAERLRQATASTEVEHAGVLIHVAVSMGVAALAEAESLASAISRADAALYCSKAEGRNRVTLAALAQFDEDDDVLPDPHSVPV